MKAVRRKITFFLVSLLAFLAITAPAYAADGWTQLQTHANQIANLARAMGLPEDNPIIAEASRIWWEEAVRLNREAEERQEREAACEAFLQEHEADAAAMAHVMYCEARGLDAREMSMVSWCILNRLDSGRFGSTITGIITARGQFAYSARSKTVSDNGTDLVWLAKDVLSRWYREKQGEAEVGRTLPQGFCFYYGNGRHNYFRLTNNGSGEYIFGLPNPYE